jgi:hypothetical protein
MYTVETVESLHAYADRLRTQAGDRAQFSTNHTPRRSAVRELVRRVRRSA